MKIGIRWAGILLLFIFILSGSGWTQNSQATKLKARVSEYIQRLYPQIQGLIFKNFKKDERFPFYRGTVRFTGPQGQQQEGYFFVTMDGRYLIIGEIYDLTIDPEREQWTRMKQGAEQRLSIIDLKNRPFKGAPDAPVVVVEYSDYQCPFCRRAFDNLEPKLMEEYGDRIKFVYKHFPLTSIHPWAMKAAIAAACAHQQGSKAFWGMHERLFKNQRQITVDNLRSKIAAFAEELNMDKEKFLACFDKEETRPIVEADMREAQRLGVGGTPTFFINGVQLPQGAMPYTDMKRYVEMALADAEAQPKGKKTSGRSPR